jgi:mRNA-degrading endonuclease RelE of RelBE toxin-antitoxin system
MFKEKPIKVVITGKAKEEFDDLNKTVGQEIKKGITSSNYQTLLKSIKQKIDLLRVNPEYGINIPKNRIPKIYIIDYDVNNLWKINLSNSWRMIYTIKGNNIEIVSLIFDLMNHKNHNKKFGYKKK